jgi:hypothetical protein
MHLFRWYWGSPRYAEAWGRELLVAFCVRRDLMTRPEDEGRYVLVGAEVHFRIARSWTYIEDKMPWWRGWRCFVRFRSDAAEILSLQPRDA